MFNNNLYIMDNLSKSNLNMQREAKDLDDLDDDFFEVPSNEFNSKLGKNRNSKQSKINVS